MLCVCVWKYSLHTKARKLRDGPSCVFCVFLSAALADISPLDLSMPDSSHRGMFYYRHPDNASKDDYVNSDNEN